jgi:hypothetical protein
LGAGGGCNTLTGRFDVLEAVFRSDGSVVSFAVDFEQHCEGLPAALFGVVRVNSSNAPPRFDQDLDGVIDVADNCPLVANPGQENRDGDELGDACDPFPDDADNLGVCIDQLDGLQEEIVLLRAALADADEDGRVDAEDTCPATGAGRAVDSAGCSHAEFCASWARPEQCNAADWRNDEPVRSGDCRWNGRSGCRVD